ncbi:COG4223 family protein [Parvularcula oceani]|uniref:COG4223 family protein n=1 Tax=Parvularcula oceani TaxID=1247963 RepID=UPI0004E221EE|nr:mitofilin family membrane protein [Parvularcula oceani]
MADETPKTPSNDPKNKSEADTTRPEAEKVTVSEPAGTDKDAPETVDAEIVDQDRVQSGETLGTADAAASGTTDRTGTAGRPHKKKGGGATWLIILVVALAVIALIAFFLGAFDGDDADLAGRDGIVVTDAEDTAPFPGNELDDPAEGPIVAVAAPGTREAAVEADAAGNEALRPSQRAAIAAAAAAAARMEATDGDDEPITAAPVTGGQDAVQDEERTRAISALRARAAERRAEQQATDEEEPAAQGQDGEPAASAQAEAPAAGNAQESRMQEAARRRAALLRAEREAEARRAAEASRQEARQAETPQAEAQQAGAEDEAQAPAELARPSTPASRPEQDSQSTPFVTRPTGRVTSLSPADEAEDEDAGEAETGQGPSPIQPRPAVVRADPNLDERLNAVRADVREEVLAETDERIQTVIAQTEREVQALRSAMTEQEQRSSQRIAQLQDRLEVLQNRDVTATQQGVLILALSSLGTELEQGRPFERQLADVERLAPNARSLNFARRYAGTGLPTDAELRERFREAAREALARARRESAEGPFERLWANLTGLFTVRELGDVEGDTPSAIISRAEVALEQGDLGAAVRELRALEGAAAEAFQPWIQDADAKARVRERLDALEQAVLVEAG